MRNLVITALLATLAPAEASCADAARAVTAEVQDDRFSPAATILGPALYINPFGGLFRKWRIRSFVDKQTHSVSDQLYVETMSLFYRRQWVQAADEDAHLHRLTQLDHSSDRGSQSFDETVAVALDEGFLRAHAQGFQIKLTAHTGDWLILTVEPGQIAPVLQAVDAYGPPPTVAPEQKRVGGPGKAG